MSKDQFVIPPLDIMNQPINLGDCVVFGLGGTMNLTSGIVKKINKKTVSVQDVFEYRDWQGNLQVSDNTYHRAFNNVVVIK